MEENKELTLEDYIKSLDEITKKLDDKTISLEESVSLYTKGLEYAKKCYDILNKNEELVVSKMTEMGLQDFNVE